MTDEREKIVAWLIAQAYKSQAEMRVVPDDASVDEHVAAIRAALRTDATTEIAEAIERGDHLVWKPEPTIPVEQWITQPSVGH